MGVALQGLGIADAGDPRKQPIQIRKRTSIPGNVADAYVTSWLQSTIERRSRCLLAWQGTERALTNNRLKLST